MKNLKFVLSLFALAVVLTTSFSHLAEARIGGGRSSGFRGSRGFSPRPSNSFSSPSYQQRPSAFGNTAAAPQSGLGGVTRSPLMQGLMGGLAGSFIGSMLFRNSSFAGASAPGSGGVGLLEILLLAGLGFFVFRMFAQRKMVAAQQRGYPSQAIPAQADFVGKRDEEQDYAQTLQRYDASFNLDTFKEQRMDDFLKIQSAWNMRDLSPVEGMIAPEFRGILSTDVENLKTSGKTNKLENIAVRSAELKESWQELGKEYATLALKAQLLDYTIDDRTQEVVDGNRSQPVKFEEEWTFVRPVGQQSEPWKLTAIAN